MVYQVIVTNRKAPKGAAEILRGVFINAGFSEENIVEEFHEGKLSLSIFVDSKTQAASIKKTVGGLGLKGIQSNIKVLKDHQWKDQWKKDFCIFAITQSLDIVPVALKNKYRKSKREPIYLDIAGAFGSGLHETTKFMVELIEQYQGKYQSFLDIGTGTGLLSIAATKKGAQHVDAIDMDPGCVPVARENLSRNGCPVRSLRALSVKAFPKSRTYDFVAANLITRDLIKFKKKLSSLVRPGKYLAVSGISLENLDVIKKEYKGLPLTCLKIKKGMRWAAILYKRSNSCRSIQNKN